MSIANSIMLIVVRKKRTPIKGRQSDRAMVDSLNGRVRSGLEHGRKLCSSRTSKLAFLTLTTKRWLIETS